ncbi:hypothetical protein EHV23_05435 [Lautropia dentalis]|uniref:Uncharacterized protein n=1 Tax=Lautropia dentalis TaxID=2490857 RepID=A0A3R8MUR8_9BURK|nr:hypothetical protein [Lautropia dentalis]RRN45606.1 hypothetical protein EHV23_05435 [Lautropia dentalis]
MYDARLPEGSQSVAGPCPARTSFGLTCLLGGTNSAFGLFRLGRLQGLVRLAGFFDTTGLTALSIPVMGTIHPAAGQL